MSISKRKPKVRRDAKLKDLPEHYRVQIAGWLKEDGWQSCLQRIASELQIQAGKTALYEALAYWESEEEFNGYEAIARAQAELEARAKSGGMTPQQMEEAVDRNFVMIAAQKRDSELYEKLRYLRIRDQESKGNAKINQVKLDQKDKQIAQKDQEIWMAREKLLNDAATKLLDKALRAKADEINNSNLSNADKIAAMRQAAFAEIDELQRSGKVVIPK